MDLKKLNKVLDLEYFDGPMLSLFSNRNGDLYIYKWVDINEDSHTWLVFQITLPVLLAYISKTISEKELVLNAQNGQYSLVDIYPDLSHKNHKTFSKKKLPKRLLPSANSYFQESFCPELIHLQNISHQKKAAA